MPTLTTPSGATPRIAIIGLGYVGLPLALEFAKKFEVLGFDINARRVAELQAGRDATLEAEAAELADTRARFSADEADLAEANIYIVTVPTPIDGHKRPDLRPLISASTTIGKYLAPGDTVIYESTVYPGCTEEDCVPILERQSGLVCAFEHKKPPPPNPPPQAGEGSSANGSFAQAGEGSSAHGSIAQAGEGSSATLVSQAGADSTEGFAPPPASGGRSGGGQPETCNLKPETAGEFFAGYSPERINPGDKEHRLPTIRKVTSGSTPEAAEFVDALYREIITAGTHKAASIRVAEAAKVIENTQRDVNIALINELAMLFGRMDIDTAAVLEAAGTKWNFLPFRPGLVGGHCIGVDPYYLTHKATQIGFHPQMILAGRRTNDGMGSYVAGELVKLMARKGVYRPGARVLVLGLTFKENCPDLRNTRVVDVVAALKSYSLEVDIHDPWADAEEARREYGLDLTKTPQAGAYDAITVAVAHDEFRTLPEPGIRGWGKADAVVYDLKHILPVEITDGRL
jgi:UDP-N-acetyl-D-galactosamine dehydrogenase